MTDRMHVEAQLFRLMTAFPTFKLIKPTQELYVEKLVDLPAEAFGNAVEHYIERGSKFPTIGQLRDKTREIATAKLKRAYTGEQDEAKRVSRAERPDWGVRFKGTIFNEAFERGRRNILDRKPGEPCGCMECQYRRIDGILVDGGPVSDHIRYGSRDDKIMPFTKDSY